MGKELPLPQGVQLWHEAWPGEGYMVQPMHLPSWVPGAMQSASQFICCLSSWSDHWPCIWPLLVSHEHLKSLPMPFVLRYSVMSNSWATPWTVALQASLSMEFSRKEYWNGLPFPSPGNLPTQASNSHLLNCGQILNRLSYQGRPTFLNWMLLISCFRFLSCT